jgi:small GTP-binding protein
LLTSIYKVCIFGDGGVGKTTLIKNYITGRFEQETKMTIGVDIVSKKLIIENYEINLQIWDFGGEERFRFLLPSFCLGASGGIFMYDITRFNTIFNLGEWFNIFKKNTIFNGKHAPIFIVGGKMDLEDKRAVNLEDVLNLVKNEEYIKVFECSSKTGQNVELIFENLTIEIMKKVGLI